MYDVAQMKTLLKEHTTWDHQVIDSWGMNQTAAIFLKLMREKQQFLIDNKFVAAEKVKSYSFGTLSRVYKNFHFLFENEARTEVTSIKDIKEVESSITAADLIYDDDGFEQTYTWDELLEMYPELDGASRDYLKDFLIRTKTRVLDDELANPPFRGLFKED